MRTFEERKEEIFRRSEQRIVQRKKTVRRALLTCVPAMLCIAVLSVVVVHQGFGRLDNAAPESAADVNGAFRGSVMESPECAVETIVELTGVQLGDRPVCTDADLLNMLDQLMQPTYAQEDDKSIPHAPEASSGSESSFGGVFNEQPIDGDPYPLLLTYSDGTALRFTLRGNQLTQADGNIQYQLTDKQAAALYALLEDTQ